ncbi:MAG: hemophore-related protein [Candidatus Sericytochromatia bacterium]
MNKLVFTRLGVALGGLALSLTAGAGVASADPNLDSAVNSTCNYPQFVAALNAQDPRYASAFESSPKMQGDLQTFLAAPPDQRQRMAQRIVSNPANRDILPIVQTAFDTCSNF